MVDRMSLLLARDPLGKRITSAETAWMQFVYDVLESRLGGAHRAVPNHRRCRMYEENDAARLSSQGFDRAGFLRRAGGAGLALAGASGLSAFLGNTAAAASTVQCTEFCWVGSGQDITPFQVRDAYQKTHPNVSIEMYQGTNAATYSKIVTSLQVTPNDPLINFGFFNVGAMYQGAVDQIWLPFDKSKMPNLSRCYRRTDVLGTKVSSSRPHRSGSCTTQ